MLVKVLREAGIDEALRGLSYSFFRDDEDVDTWWEGQRAKAYKRADVLAHRQGGHNKFLESVMVWLDVKASRAWWSECDTYRVGTTKQSTSTMHTLAKREPLLSDFEEGVSSDTFLAFRTLWHEARGDINTLKMNLPEGFLQRRMVVTNYKVLQNIIYQRHDHRLRQWQTFCQEVLAQVEKPEWILSHAWKPRADVLTANA